MYVCKTNAGNMLNHVEARYKTSTVSIPGHSFAGCTYLSRIPFQVPSVSSKVLEVKVRDSQTSAFHGTKGFRLPKTATTSPLFVTLCLCGQSGARIVLDFGDGRLQQCMDFVNFTLSCHSWANSIGGARLGVFHLH